MILHIRVNKKPIDDMLTVVYAYIMYRINNIQKSFCMYVDNMV